MTLPKGGGAIRGIGERFSTNPATGTASLTIPIATSPGRGGFELDLSLTYDSGAGNGPFGLGWQLSTPSITRSTDRGLPRYGDAHDATDPDTFVLSGAEELVPVRVRDGDGTRLDIVERGAHQVQRYRPRVEGLFALIERWTDRATGDTHWRAITRDDVVGVYGRSAGARVADPEHPERVFSWLLEESRDDRGNAVTYQYEAEDGAGVDLHQLSESSRFRRQADGSYRFAATAQRYLKRVRYGNRVPLDRDAPAPSGGGDWLFEVVFDYGDHDDDAPTPAGEVRWPTRPDPFSVYRSTFEVRTYRRCRRALVFHRFPQLGSTPCLVRSTDLSYDECLVTSADGRYQQGPVASYLVAVTQAGYVRRPDGSYERATLPPLELDYARPIVHDEVRPVDGESPEGLTGRHAQWVDLDGEGLPGALVTTDAAWYYQPNLGGGRLAAAVRQSSLPALAGQGGDAGRHFADLGGDGSLDLVFHDAAVAGFYERTPERGWAPFVALSAVPNIDWEDPDLRLVDLDGDGHADVLVTEHDALVWYRSRGEEGFEAALSVPTARHEADGPAVVFANGEETLHLADVSGDGQVDLVRVRNGEVCYWPNLGFGRFGRKVTLDGDAWFDAPDQFDPARIRFADVDGSGTSDVVYLGSDGVRVYFNLSGNRLAAPLRLAALPPVDRSASLDVLDLLGNGTACLVWSSPGPAAGSHPVAYVDLMAGRKPHLLASIVNNLGSEIHLDFTPSTGFYLRDRAAGRPWLTRLPFPVHVLERVERRDLVSGSTVASRFAYHHGYFDGAEREFRGFACVEQWDAETFGGGATPDVRPPVRNVTWFHTGAWIERQGLEAALAAEFYAGDPQALVLPSTVLPADLSAAEAGEAARALRGLVLRQEIYAADGSPAAAHPYSVSQRSYEVRRVQARHGSAPGVFFAHPRHTLNALYERDPSDPRVEDSVVLDVDEVGNVTAQADVAYPRRMPVEVEQGRLVVALQQQRFANRADELDWRRIGVLVEAVESELVGPGLVAPAGGALLGWDAIAATAATATDLAYEATPDPAAAGGQRRIVRRERRLYYREDLSGALALGDVDRRALLHDVLRQAFTPGLVADAYGGVVPAAVLATVLEAEGRYQLDDGVWWAPSGRAVFDPARFHLPVEAVDVFGERHRVTYDDHALLVVDSVDPLDNHVTVGRRDAAGAVTANGNDYRVLGPAVLTDPNGNETEVAYDARGMVVATAVAGKPGSGDGDTLAQPTMQVVYDVHRWRDSSGSQPTSTHTVARERHGPGNDRFQETFTYSDGNGRVVQTKTRAEPGAVPVFDAEGHLVRNPDGSPQTVHTAQRWTGTGRTVFDNKGEVVRRYEPFFSATPDFDDADEVVQWGVTPTFHRDPLGRLVRTELPNGTDKRAVFAPWRREAWDENDMVAGSQWLARKQAGTPAEQRAAALALAHAGTPTVVHLDPLGRAFLTVADNGPLGTRSARVELDIEGNERSYTDERGTVVARQVFDMLRRTVRLVRADAGPRDAAGNRAVPVATDPGGSRTLLDAADQPVRSWDELGHAVRRRFDPLQRRTHVLVRTGDNPERLVEHTVHGEAHPDAAARNLRTRVHREHDGAGAVVNERYDLDGNLTHSHRRLALDVADGPDWSVVDGSGDLAAIEAAASALVEPERHVTKARHDALRRVELRMTPDGSVARPSYNEANLLERIDVWVRGLDPATQDLRASLLPGGAEDDARWAAVVADIDYDAHGQRVLVVHGNGTTARFTYDRESFRLVHQRLDRDADGVTLQDLAYQHDPVGNVVAVADGVSFANPGVPGDGLYTYDALYQLATAEGREHPGQPPGPHDVAALRLGHPNDMQGLRRYRETYDHDAAGNLTRVAHTTVGPGGVAWTRRHAYSPDSNRLVASGAGNDPDGPLDDTYDHDDAGNMARLPHLFTVGWDHAQRLRVARTQAGAGGNEVRMVYDATGQRVRKVFVHGNVVEDRAYLGDYELYRRREAAADFERQTLRLTDGQRAVALVETKTVDTTAPPFTPTSRWRHQASDHLDSVRLELDRDGAVFSYEELFPYGSSAWRAADAAVEVSPRRYRYTGHERDEETGFDHCGARSYASWLGRWTSPDPAGVGDGLNLYRYVRNNPMRYVDPSGTDSTDPTGASSGGLDTLRLARRTTGAAGDGSGAGGGGPPSPGSGAGATTATAARPSRVPTTGPSGRSGASGSGGSRSAPARRGVGGVFDKIADALRDAASWIREWLPGLIAAPLAGLVDILGGFVRTLGGLFTWNGSVAVRGLKDMGLGALSILGLKELLTEPWKASAMNPGDPTTALKLPETLQQDIRDAAARIPENAPKNGMHAWHAATNAAVAHRAGPAGVIPLFIAGVVHESPIDWGSFMAEQESQGTINHILDSLMDIVANVFGILIGLLLPRGWAIEVAAVLGNHIPGPGDPNPRGLPGVHGYTGKPSQAWGQYP